MDRLRAKVVNGRLLLDMPCDLPDGTTLELIPADASDDLSDADRNALHAELDRAWLGVKAGEKLIPAEEFLDALAKRR